MYDFELNPTKNKKVMYFSVFGTNLPDLSHAPWYIIYIYSHIREVAIIIGAMFALLSSSDPIPATHHVTHAGLTNKQIF